MTSETSGLNIMDMPETLSEIMPRLFNNVLSNQDWIFTAFIFAMVILAVYGISRINLDYSKDISIGLGALLTIISFVIANLLAGMEVNIAQKILFVVISALIAEIIRFFDIVLDYSRSERVEFEDEENYYYVKVIPKVLMSKRARVNLQEQPQDGIED
jgi:glucan phosphoethanolaminetransferase (alkaline phosphatase superfamily)